jgi:oligopeptide transport system substrate-binding protein
MGNSREQHILPIIYMVDDPEKWNDLTELKKALPGMGESVSEEFIRKEIATAEESIPKAVEVKVKYANLKQNLGINIELNGVEDQVYSSTRADGSYDLIRHSWTADFNDPINYLDLYTSYSGGNYNGVNSPEYDALIEASNETTDQNERNDLLHQAEQLLVGENFYVIPVATQVYICLRNPRLTNVSVNEKGEPMYRYADLAE